MPGWDETSTSYRYRIREPDEFIEDSFRTITFGDSRIKAVVGKLPDVDSMILQSLIFPKNIFSETEARQMGKRISRHNQENGYQPGWANH